jgi:hypothetical protein
LAHAGERVSAGANGAEAPVPAVAR